MRGPLILRKSFMAGTKYRPRDVETITEALRATGFLPHPAGVGPAGGGVVSSEAEVGDALRAFQDRKRLVLDGYAAPRGPTESELRKTMCARDWPMGRGRFFTSRPRYYTAFSNSRP